MVTKKPGSDYGEELLDLVDSDAIPEDTQVGGEDGDKKTEGPAKVTSLLQKKVIEALGDL